MGKVSERLKEQVGRVLVGIEGANRLVEFYLADVREERPWLLELYVIRFVFVDESSAPKIYSFRDNKGPILLLNGPFRNQERPRGIGQQRILKGSFDGTEVIRPENSIVTPHDEIPVGSRTGAVFRRSGLSGCSPFPLGVPH